MCVRVEKTVAQKVVNQKLEEYVLNDNVSTRVVARPVGLVPVRALAGLC